MDFDPGECFDDSEYYESSDEMIDDAYEEGFEDAQEEGPQEEDVVEYDDNGNPIYLAAAAGFGYHMGQNDLEERKLAENILNRRSQKKNKDIIKVPLSRRNEKEGYMTPFARWSTRANQELKAAKEPIKYTKEERIKIIRAQYEE